METKNNNTIKENVLWKTIIYEHAGEETFIACFKHS